MDLHALADFNLVARHGGFGRAARAAGRPKASLSRRIAQLERDLDVQLIERGARSLRLTEAGDALHTRTDGLLAEITEAGEAVVSGAHEPVGRLRISAPVVYAHVALGRFAARFADAYPAVTLDIVTEDRLVDPVAEGYDFVIRINPRPTDHLIGRCIRRDSRVVVAAPGIADAGFASPSVTLIAQAPGTTWPIVDATGTRTILRPTPRLRLSSLLLVRDAVAAGAGIAALPAVLVDEDIAAGRLVALGQLDEPPVEIWALQSARRAMAAKSRAFLDMLVMES